MVNRATLVILIVLRFTSSPSSSFIPQRRLLDAPKSSTATTCQARWFVDVDVAAHSSFKTRSASFRQIACFAENASLGGNESDGGNKKNDENESIGDSRLSRDHGTVGAVVNKHLSKGYIAAKYLFAATSLLIFATPDLSWGLLLLQKWSGGAGYACAAALFDILQTAHANGRQSSDTYKRLHMALATFSVVSLTAVPGEAGFFRLAQQGQVISLLTSVRTIGALVALWGWKASMQKNLVQELANEIVNTLKGLRVRNRKKALSYRNSFLIVLCAAFSSFFQGRFLRSYQTEFLKTNFEISLQWSAVARLSMIAVMILTLKDAAERDRLGGTTFIQLNVLVGMVAVAAGLGQAVYPVGPAARRGVLFFFFSGLFFLNAYKGQRTKQQQQLKQQKRLER